MLAVHLRLVERFGGPPGVVVATWTAGRRIPSPAFEFAVSLQPAASPGVWDRFGLWTVVAVLLIVLAYAWPLAHLLSMPRFGSPPIKPL